MPRPIGNGGASQARGGGALATGELPVAAMPQAQTTRPGKSSGGVKVSGNTIGYDPGTLAERSVNAVEFEKAKTIMVPNPKANPWALFAVVRLYASCWKNRPVQTGIGHLVLLSLMQISGGVVMGIASTAQGTAVKVSADNTGSVAAGATQVLLKAVTPTAQNFVLPVSANLAGAKYNAPARNAIAPAQPAPSKPGATMVNTPGVVNTQPGISWDD